MSKPARPDLKFSSMDEMLADVDTLRGGSCEQTGKWNMAMILDHLAKIIASPFAPPQKNLPWPITAIGRFMIHRMAVSNKYPPIRLSAPKAIRPDHEANIDIANNALCEAVQKLKVYSGDTINCPPIGQVPTQDFRTMQLLHAAHHLSYLKRQ